MIALAFVVSLASQAQCPLPVLEHVSVARVDSGDGFELVDGRRVKLAAVIVPDRHDPLADEARERLSDRIARRTIGLAFDELAIDRHGALLAHVFIEDDWLQHALIGDGFARVRTYSGTAKCAAPLLAAEDEARKSKRGLWALSNYRIRDADDLDDALGAFQIVEGEIVAVARSKGRVFVNFGADYRTDFTVTISTRDARRLAKTGIDPSTWLGKRIRVRGWLSRLNGPELELTHTAQIQILE